MWQPSGAVFERSISRWLLALALLGGASTASARAANGRQVHVVYEGQRLGSIAKRYNVSIEAICEANGIQRRDPIRPGQRLEIPSREEAARKVADESSASPAEIAVAPGPVAKASGREQVPAKAPAAPSSKTPEVEVPARSAAKTSQPAVPTKVDTKPPVLAAVSKAPSDAAPESAKTSPATVPFNPLLTGSTHRVQSGESLSGIALKYKTNVKTLVQLNNLKRDQLIRVGQVLAIPRPAAPDSWWAKFARAPRRAGEMDVYAHTNRWKGKVVVSGKVQSSGRAALSRLLGATGNAPAVPERLIQLLAHVSDTFGGRPVRLVSGYRTNSYFKDSRHKHSSAVDFSIDGVPNSAVRDYLLQLGNVGVGYYPNSSFVHLDVRARSAYWVDYAGPGQAPRKTPGGDTRLAANGRKSKRKATRNRPVRRTARADAPMLRELDQLAERAVQGIKASSSRPVTETGSPDT